MRIIDAEPGEAISDAIKRAMINLLIRGNENAVKMRHNHTEIIIFQRSCYEDLCEKFDMQRRINVLESQYRR